MIQSIIHQHVTSHLSQLVKTLSSKDPPEAIETSRFLLLLNMSSVSVNDPSLGTEVKLSIPLSSVSLSGRGIARAYLYLLRPFLSYGCLISLILTKYL